METCGQCGKRGDTQTIRRCTSCMAIRYCSQECQRRHWPQHKAQCKKIRKAGRKVPAPDDSGHDQGQSTAAAAGATETGAVKRPTGNGDTGTGMTCKKCGRQSREMKRCGICQEVTYCSRDCQRGDWKAHKVTCQAVEVITTEGFRQTEERERQAEGRAALERERVARQRQRDILSELFSSVHVTPRGLSWEEARSRVQRLYPGKQIVDKFRQLQNDMLFVPNAERVVALVRMKEEYPHWFRHGRCLEDCEGNRLFVLFYNDGDPMPHFRYSQLREGNFLCYHNAHLHFFLDGTVGFRINEAKDVHILEP